MAKKQVNTISTFQVHWFTLGPLYFKLENQEKKKVWVCLFTCVVVRAVHLEIVDDLKAEEFLLEFISDNADQFKLSKSTIDVAWQKVMALRKSIGKNHLTSLQL